MMKLAGHARMRAPQTGDPKFAPGVFFFNRTPRKTSLHLRDIPVTILREFGAPVPTAMTENSIL